MNLLIRNGRVIDPASRLDCIGDVLITNGTIAQTGEYIIIDDPQLPQFAATGLIVSPGFVDLHCHLREPGFEEKETIATGTMAAAKGGFTTVCCMPNTNPPIATRDVMGQVLQIAQREGVIRVLPIAAVTAGRNGAQLADLDDLHNAGAVAFSDDGSPVHNSEIMRQALEQSKALGIPIMNHCEDLALSGDGAMNEGKTSARLGYKGIPAAAEETMIARDIALAKDTGGLLHIAHVSTAGSVELIRKAKDEGISITAEVTPHHLTLTEETVIEHGTNAKVNPPLRTMNDIEALIAGLRDGTIDAIATDHAPHTHDDKAQSFDQAAFGISGFETAFGSLMTLVHRGSIDLATIISKLTIEPAKILGNPQISATMKIGSTADITIFDPCAEWTVNPNNFVSKGKNTPLAGTVLKGKVIATIVAGHLVYEADS
ncbi:MAG: dihydroorotase [Chloroflexi bacterium]|jgi:dihydroorotase|nr:dihydroorotase [Chloroflexota bacterium]